MYARSAGLGCPGPDTMFKLWPVFRSKASQMRERMYMRYLLALCSSCATGGQTLECISLRQCRVIRGVEKPLDMEPSGMVVGFQCNSVLF